MIRFVMFVLRNEMLFYAFLMRETDKEEFGKCLLFIDLLIKTYSEKENHSVAALMMIQISTEYLNKTLIIKLLKAKRGW